MFLALPKLSATSDEVTHLPSGYSYWVTRDFRMNPEHPPLMKLLAALPLLALKPGIDTTNREWMLAGDHQYLFGFNFLYKAVFVRRMHGKLFSVYNNFFKNTL